ncbi:hypothetical protein ACR9E3_20935 [Actinomycetospora sp. C-140]
MSTLDRLDDETSETLRTVLGHRAPDLLHALQSTDTPSMALREQVDDVMADELSGEITGPDWDPTPHGVRVEAAITRFLVVYEITHPVRGTDAWPPVPDLRGPDRAGRP